MLGTESSELDELDARVSAEPDTQGKKVLASARGLGRRGALLPTDLDIYEGELLGVAGLLGAGRTELARLISGVDRAEAGQLNVDGERRQFRAPREALAAGIAYSSENRKTEGIIAELSVRENITLALQAERGWLRRIPRSRQDELSASWIEALGIRPSDPERAAGVLSGGNQQKVMLARLLALAPRLLVLDEPTRGIDVGAKVEIQRLITDLASTGMSVIFISAELEEVLRVGHRIIVVRDREIVATLDPDTVNFEMLLAIVAKADGDT
jgi:simple sugar transport system ATP-binding protein